MKKWLSGSFASTEPLVSLANFASLKYLTASNATAEIAKNKTAKLSHTITATKRFFLFTCGRNSVLAFGRNDVRITYVRACCFYFFDSRKLLLGKNLNSKTRTAAADSERGC